MGSGVIMCVTGCMYCIPVLVHIASSDVHVCRFLSAAPTSTLGHWNVYITSPLFNDIDRFSVHLG